MIDYRWKMIKRVYKKKLDREYREGNIDEYTYLISILINKLDNYIVREAYIAKVLIFSEDKIERYKNINQIIDIYRKGIRKRDINNSMIYRISLKAGCINILAKNIYDAFRLRKIGHSSGYKYSKVYLLNEKYPLLRIEGTENIIIPLDHKIDTKLEKFLNRILPEFINRNIKRASSLIKNLEKLKY